MTNTDKKIDFWKKKLLDLSLRNRLINCPLPKKTGRISRSSITIIKPGAAALWELFTEDNKPFVFPQAKVSNKYDSDSGDNSASVTNQDLNETQKTLRNLKTKARVFTEEKGLNALHLAFTFLHWKDKNGVEMRSPLLLVPVQLSQDDLFSPFVLSRHDDEISPNFALSQKLFNEYRIVLPDYSSLTSGSDDMDFNDYIVNVQKICAAMQCTVSLDVELSLFSFLKINMYQDLEKHTEKIKLHPLIKTIAGDTKSSDTKSVSTGLFDISGFNHDITDPQNIFSVVDADSSQQDAILLAKRGASFVLQGPPGTGKSQTITNIISELLSCGKKVLFVSEKMAALEVVKKRLTAAGLNNFCLTLHSYKAKRREVIDQLEASIKLAQNKAVLSGSAFDKLSRLVQQCKSLNDYVQELHSVIKPIDKTIFCINGKIASLYDIPDIMFNVKNPGTITPSGFIEIKNLLEDLSRIAAEKGYQEDNPWRGCTLKNITNQFRQQFSAESVNAVDTIDSVTSFKPAGNKNYDAAALSYNDYKNYAGYIELNKNLENESDAIKQKYTDRIFTINGEELLARCRTKYRNFLRIFNSSYRKDRDFIAGSLKTEEKLQFTDIKTLAEKLSNLQNIKNDIERLSNLIDTGFPAETIAQFYEKLTPNVNWFSGMFEENQNLLSMPLIELRKRIQDCMDNFSDLEYYIDYRDILFKSSGLGIEEFILQAAKAKLPADIIIPAFEKCFYSSLFDAILPQYNAVNSFRRLKHDDIIKSFMELDLSHMDISKAALISKLITGLPSFDGFTSEYDEIGLLKREMVKQRKLMPTRKLIASLPNLLPVLKPCMMMSPLSVSTYLGGGNYEFDTVIFDEASQVRTEDAICAISRAKQIIIAGDSKQLPPSDFFNSSTSVHDDDDVYNEDDEFNDEGAFESLLDEASLLPSQTLLWHYRSRHEHLIAFSNVNIYRGSLITFPSSVETAEDIGVQYIHVKDGTYDRGGKNGNRAEAEKAAELIFDHFNKNPERSLGVIAFGAVQQEAITEALLQKRKDNPSFEHFFRDDLEEAVFIKNLETVQGDERDTIIFCIGYAPDANGKFIMNFGPLSNSGGERRLNVAVTRARYNIKLVGSILPADIDADRISSTGPKLLRQYIDFAINGAAALPNTLADNNTQISESLFEKVIYDFITANGYDVVTQAGCSDYKIDMAVRHPDINGCFAIGIECDGASYRIARTARERDRLRQNVLEKMGWKMYRIWSTEWIKDPKSEGKKLLSAIEDAIYGYNKAKSDEPQKNVSKKNVSEEYINLTEKPEEKEIILPCSQFYGKPANEIPISDIENVMIKIITDSFGIDKEGLLKTTAVCYGWQRRGEVIKQCLEKAYQQLLGGNKIMEKDGKIMVY